VHRWVLVLLALAPLPAWAGNGTKLRTLVQWPDAPCMTLVDRTQSAVLHLDYAIPNEDTDVTSDEVADSRTHQFFATCRTSLPLDVLPTWITAADVDAATTKGLVTVAIPPVQILETNEAWAGCWTRIVADDERRPITFAMADAGVDWDTSTLPPGAYTVHGYTYEPAVNLWVQRPGVVKVHDGDPDAAGPAAAITTGELSLYRDGVAQIEGCVDAPAGTTVTAEWTAADRPELEWVPFVVDAPVEGDAFTLELEAPEGLVERWGAVRATFTAPDGRGYSTMMPAMITVLPQDDPGMCGAGFIDQPCAETEDGDGSESSGSPGEVEGSAGCACANDRSSGHAGWWLAVLLLVFPRRRSAIVDAWSARSSRS